MSAPCSDIRPQQSNNTASLIVVVALAFGAVLLWIAPDKAKPVDLEREAVSACRIHHIDNNVDVAVFGGYSVTEQDNGMFKVVIRTKSNDYRRCAVTSDGRHVVSSN